MNEVLLEVCPLSEVCVGDVIKFEDEVYLVQNWRYSLSQNKMLVHLRSLNHKRDREIVAKGECQVLTTIQDLCIEKGIL